MARWVFGRCKIEIMTHWLVDSVNQVIMTHWLMILGEGTSGARQDLVSKTIFPRASKAAAMGFTSFCTEQLTTVRQSSAPAAVIAIIMNPTS